MTKIDLKLNEKEGKTEEEAPPLPAAEEEEAREEVQEMDEALRDVGLSDMEEGVPPPPSPKSSTHGYNYQSFDNRTIGINWRHLRLNGLMQLLLSMGMFGCLIGMTAIGGSGRMGNFAPGMWGFYLMMTGYMGWRSGSTRSYGRALAYCMMSAFQSMVYMTSMCWFLTIGLVAGNYGSYGSGGMETQVMVALLTFGQAGALVGTIMTGIYGVVHTCVGIGRLLHYQEDAIKKSHFIVTSA